MLAITTIKERGNEKDWDTVTQLIKVCEFISSKDLDRDLNIFLRREKKNGKS